MGTRVGLAAHNLFPGGVRVDAAPWAHDDAMARTAALIADPDIPVIFEAAFEQEGVRIRVDVLERLEDGDWGLREVKATTPASEAKGHFDDVAIQLYVLRGAGLTVPSVELVHIDNSFVRGEGPIDWVTVLPHLGSDKVVEMAETGFEAIGEIPENWPLNAKQAAIREAVVTDRLAVFPGLAQAMAPLGPPFCVLDFETIAPAIPLYPGTRPYQQVPFQWSLHIDRGDGRLEHAEYLADGDRDPRRALADALVAAVPTGANRQYSAIFRVAVQEGLAKAKTLPERGSKC